MRCLSLFSGICGLDLGLRLAVPALRTAGYVESDAYCRKIIRARIADGLLDDAPIFDDVRSFDPEPWADQIDIVIGGPPCQPVSLAGNRKGDLDERWLWPDLWRIVRAVRPQYVFVENPPGLLAGDWFGYVLGSLASLGFSAQWTSVRASDVGAPHRRERIFLLAYAQDAVRGPRVAGVAGVAGERRGGSGSGGGQLADTGLLLGEWDASPRHTREARVEPPPCGGPFPDAPGRGFGILRQPSRSDGQPDGCDAPVADANRGRLPKLGEPLQGVRHERTSWDIAHGRYRAESLVAHANRSGLEEWAGERSDASGQRPAPQRGSRDALANAAEPGRFPPGPGDRPGWERVLATRPDLAPAIEPPFRHLDDGSTDWLLRVRADRRQQLRALGNAVVPQQAALAFRILWGRLLSQEP